MTIRQRLQDVAQSALTLFDQHPLGGQLMQGTLPIAYLKGYYAQLARYVGHSRALLEATATELKQTHPELSLLSGEKALEENDDHVRWIYQDLAALGVSQEQAQAAPLAAATEAYIAWNWHMVESGCAAAFLGTAFALEAVSSRRAGSVADNLERCAGVPARALTFLRQHGELDGDHTEQLLAALDRLPSGLVAEQVLLSARVTAQLMPGMIVEFAS